MGRYGPDGSLRGGLMPSNEAILAPQGESIPQTLKSSSTFKRPCPADVVTSLRGGS